MSKIKKRIIGLLFIATMLIGIMSPMTICSAVNEPVWKTLYRDKLRSVLPKYPDFAALIDINVDGTPELLIGYQPGSGGFSQLYSAFTFKNGVVVSIFNKNSSIDIEDIDTSKLYYNPTTNE